MGVQQMLLSPDPDTKAILQYLCEQSGKLYQSGIYYSRQLFFKTGKMTTGKFDLDFEPTVSKTAVAQSLPSTPAQQTLRSVTEAWASFKELRKLHKQGQLPFRPKPPGYLEGTKLFKIAYPNSGGQKPVVKDGMLRFSLGLTVKRWFAVSEFFLPIPSNLDLLTVKEFTILPKNGEFYLECSYEVAKKSHDLNPELALGIDLGTSANLAACVDTLGNSFLIDAFALKAMNQLWNKRVATRQEGKPEAYWDSWLDRVTRKRNHQMRDGVNKAAKLIVEHAIDNGIGTIVCGWNEGFKTESNMGRVNNQKFVQMPLAKLRDRIKQLGEKHGINFVQTEESYTSKSSYLDGDSLPKYGEKPEGWKASGKRVLRGLYQTAQGFKVNADLNGAANILRKVASNLGLDLSRVVRRSLTTVARVKLWANPTVKLLSAESPSL
jgi:IS605 OrfB family transposase